MYMGSHFELDLAILKRCVALHKHSIDSVVEERMNVIKTRGEGSGSLVCYPNLGIL